MSQIRNKAIVACIVAGLLMSSLAAADPPGRVGRLNLTQGGVSLRPAQMGEWSTAILNYPLSVGHSLWTEEASLAEVHVGSTAIRLGPRTECFFLELDDQKVRLSLPQGLLNVRLRELDSGEIFEVDTPTLRVAFLRPGSYRLEVRNGGETQVTVREGEIQAVVDGLSYPIRAHQAAFIARSDTISFELRKASAADEWERWCAERDRREDVLVSVQYVPRAMIGCEDLDWYGSWIQTPDYGPVWIPSSLPAGWAPYRFGHWAWVEPWGWTWIDDMPWGFAPFHYGRWALSRGVWVWVPGSMLYKPVYAPALVVFVEAGPAVLKGRIGWFPLGPRELYVPPYHASRVYLQRVNTGHIRIGDLQTIDTSKARYAHREHPQALTVVSGEELSRERVGGTKVSAAPQREGVLGSEAFPWFKQQPGAAETVLKAAPKRDSAQRPPQLRQAAKDQAPQTSQKRQKIWKKKKLPNGQWLWVEEWVEE